MALPQRHQGAPFADGEFLRGRDLENDVAQLTQEIANLEDINVPSGADISATKLALGSLPGNRFINNVITSGKFTDATIDQTRILNGEGSNSEIESDDAGAGPVGVGGPDLEILFTELQTAKAAGDVLLMAIFSMSEDGGGDLEATTLYFARDGVEISGSGVSYGGDADDGNPYSFTMQYVDTAATDDTLHTYAIYCDTPVAGDRAFDNVFLLAIELRR